MSIIRYIEDFTLIPVKVANGITYKKIDGQWWEPTCWKCGLEERVEKRVRYPNVADTAWACKQCNEERGRR